MKKQAFKRVFRCPRRRVICINGKSNYDCQVLWRQGRAGNQRRDSLRASFENGRFHLQNRCRRHCPFFSPSSYTPSAHPLSRPGTSGSHTHPKSSSGKVSQSPFVSSQYEATVKLCPSATHSLVPRLGQHGCLVFNSQLPCVKVSQFISCQRCTT